MDIDYSEDTNRDILGKVRSSLRKPILKQTFSPGELSNGDAAQKKLWNLGIKDQDYAALANQDVLIVHFYAGVASAPFAERYTSCSIKPTNIGGEGGGTIGMETEITYGGDRITGTATASGGVVTFTPDEAPVIPTLTALTLTNATLSPTFAAGVNEYTATASSSSSTLTATAAAGTGVVIVVNGSSVASGASISWAEGDNLIDIILSKDGASNEYRIHVTYSA